MVPSSIAPLLREGGLFSGAGVLPLLHRLNSIEVRMVRLKDSANGQERV